jgi:hypothetical protein
MRSGYIIMTIAAVGMSFSMAGCTQNVSEKRAVSPTMGERIKQDSVTGKVHDLGARHVSIKDDAGETTRVRVDDQTKMDQVTIGDQVKAFVSDDGYASTIQRVSP